MLYEKIIKHYNKIKNLEHASALLQWDQAIYMPNKGLASRADIMSDLAGILHQTMLNDSYYENLCNIIESSEFKTLNDLQKSEVKLLKYNTEKQRKIPHEFASQLAKIQSLGMSEWQKAKTSGNDENYLPILEKLINLKREYASFIGFDKNPYNALLDDFDRGMTYDKIEPLFVNLKKSLIKILEKIENSNIDIDDKFLFEGFNAAKRIDYGKNILNKMGIDYNAFRTDYSEHPFTTTIGLHDVRITTNLNTDNFLSGLFSTFHEGGHALYELGAAEAFENSPCGVLESLPLHESQSRFYENIIGRSAGFWNNYYNELEKMFPENLKNITKDQFYRAINKVKKSPIRTEADEVHYNLHIILRTELENKLINDKIPVTDIEDAWNEYTKEIFGFYPESKSESYLQDIHWSDGSFGYFPTYTLGNLASAQLSSTIEKDIGGFTYFDDETLGEIHKWLKENVYKYGNIFTTNELLEKVTGQGMDSKFFIKYLEKKFISIYKW